MDQRAKDLRRLIVKGLMANRSGHVGSSMSLVEIIRVLYDDFLNFHPQDPDWSERDRLILSKGHGCLALFAVLADKGFFSKEELDKVCHPEAMLGGHPEKNLVPGIEASTGALGHGLSIGVGMACAARIKKMKYRVVVITGDGELNEGSVWEAALHASKHKLSNLIVLVDRNQIQCFGPTEEVLAIEPLSEKWKSFGFNVQEIDGHSLKELKEALKNASLSVEKPSVIICRTIKGKGIPLAENNPDWHHRAFLSDDEINRIYSCL